MIVNTVKFDIVCKKRFISLFRDIDGLEENVQKSIKHYSLRLSKEYDSWFWEKHDCRNAEVLYFPIYREEVRGIKASASLEEVDISDNCRLCKAVLQEAIVSFFRKKGNVVRRNFIGDIEVWLWKSDTPEYRNYQRYVLRIRHNDMLDGWQMDIAESHEAMVAKSTTRHIEGLPADGFSVLVGNAVVPIDKLRQYHWTNFQGNFYPIINRQIAKIVGADIPFTRDPNKLKTKLEGAQSFLDKLRVSPDFCSEVGISFPDGYEFVTLPDEKVMMVDEEAKDLLYGGDHEGRSPRTEFARYKPYRQPPVSPTVFFICKSDKLSQSYVRRLYNIFMHKVDYPQQWSPEQALPQNYRKFNHGLADFIAKEIDWNARDSIMFENYDTILKDVESQLKEKAFSETKRHLAFVVTDLRKDDADTKRRTIYYKLKELLLNYGIESQFIRCDHVDNPLFKFYLPNIGSAVVGKMGGMAWGVKPLLSKNDMVVGIGASKQPGHKKPYLGSAFCFDGEGRFKNFDFCRADDMDALQSTLNKALLNFYENSGKPDRIIIHYYKKKLNRTESKIIDDMLNDNGLQCPVFVVNVVVAVNEDLIAFDTHCADRMPQSGTYVHLRRSDYLLYNNERYAPGSGGEVLPPVKLSVRNASQNDSEKLSEDDAKEIITQIYQFCRLYSRSVKMQNMPITIAYPALLALDVAHFEDEMLPDFGKNSLWML